MARGRRQPEKGMHMGTGSALAALAGMGMLAILVMAVVGIFVAALVLSVAYRIVVGNMPSYPRALGTVVLAWLASLVVTLVLRVVMSGGLGGLLVLAAQFLIGAAVINLLLPSGSGQIGYGKACLVQLVYLVAFIVLAFVLGLLAALLFGSMLHH